MHLRELSSLTRADADTFGAKAANLGELINAGFEVPVGFVVPPGLALAADPLSPGEAAASSAIGGPLAELASASVAVRSSAIGEDGSDASHAGMYDSFTAVVGEAAVIDAVGRCRASVDSERAVAYRAARGLPTPSAMAVIVQAFVDADLAGVLFTTDPRPRGSVAPLIEAVEGAGTGLVSGTVAPISLEPQVFDELAEIGSRVQEHFGKPMDIEWCRRGEQTYLLQARPITASRALDRGDAIEGRRGGLTSAHGASVESRTALVGHPASPGVAIARAEVLHGPEDLDRFVAGSVLVTHHTSPEWTAAMVHAAAVVTETGGVTSHAAIVARELAIPCVVGIAGATTSIGDGDRVRVDGTSGTVEVLDHGH